jgi:ATP-dependent Clp protease adaptor protein ClpS
MGNQEKLNPEFDELFEDEINEQHHLILHNDEVNTFDHVIDSLIEVCKHEFEQAEQCALITHYKGKCDIKAGEFDKLLTMKRRLSSKGLSVTIE